MRSNFNLSLLSMTLVVVAAMSGVSVAQATASLNTKNQATIGDGLGVELQFDKSGKVLSITSTSLPSPTICAAIPVSARACCSTRTLAIA